MKANEDFIAYCMSFYGDVDGGLHYFEEDGFPPMQIFEIKAVLPLIKEVYPEEFNADDTLANADSTTREMVRDFVIHGRGYNLRSEWHTSTQSREVFKANRDSWGKELEERQALEPAKGAGFLRLWNEITKEADIKPKWFGFLSN
jgi:hypothetical protein